MSDKDVIARFCRERTADSAKGLHDIVCRDFAKAMSELTGVHTDHYAPTDPPVDSK